MGDDARKHQCLESGQPENPDNPETAEPLAGAARVLCVRGFLVNENEAGHGRFLQGLIQQGDAGFED